MSAAVGAASAAMGFSATDAFAPVAAHAGVAQ